MMPRTYEAGDSIYALWPGSSLYYKAIVQNYDPVEKVYSVQFESTEEVIVVLKKHVMAVSQVEGKTRGRSQSPSRKKSPSRRSRSGSRSRKRGRSTSPARSRKMQPAKKTTAEVEENKIVTEEVVQQTIETKSHVVVQEQVTIKKVEHTENSYRRRLRSSHKNEEVNDQKDNRVLEEKLADKKEPEVLSWKFWLLQNLGFLVLFIFSLVFFPSLYLLCLSKQQCTVKKLPAIPPWTSFFKAKAFYIVEGFILFQVLLYLLPIGKLGERKEGGETVVYRGNGIYSAIVTVAACVGLQYSKIGKEISTFVVVEYLSILTASITICLVASLILMLFAPGSLSQHGSGISLSNFLFGKTHNPVPKLMDIKLFLFFRIGFIGSTTLTICLIGNTAIPSLQVDPALMMVALSHLMITGFYCLVEERAAEQIGFEDFRLGLFSLIGSVVWVPFFFFCEIRFVSYFQKQCTPQQYVGMGLLIGFGTYLYIVSNYQKMTFRHNQNLDAFKDVEVVVTPDGRNLLCHGWWGRVRHPNYLGDILQTIGWALPCGFTHLVPWMFPIYVTILLVMRAVHNDRACALRHGKGWEEYKRRVPYSLVPFVY